MTYIFTNKLTREPLRTEAHSLEEACNKLGIDLIDWVVEVKPSKQ